MVPGTGRSREDNGGARIRSSSRQAVATAMVEAVDTVGVEARADRTRIAEGARVY